MRRSLLGAGLLGLAGAGCAASGGPDRPPEIEVWGSADAVVGVRHEVVLRASDPDGDDLTFAFRSDLPGLGARASLATFSGGHAVFSWVPLGTDVGMQTFEFVVSDGELVDQQQRTVRVWAQDPSTTAPVFRRPVASGTTFDPTSTACVVVPVEVDDPDDPVVTLAHEAPGLEGATLEVDSGHTATWRWCPPEDTPNVAEVVFLAADGDHPPVRKSFLVVAAQSAPPSCAGLAPAIAHQPPTAPAGATITIEAAVQAPSGLAHAPVLYTSTTDPGPHPHLGSMVAWPMTLVSGTSQTGTWSVELPNPAVYAKASTLHYVLRAVGGEATSACHPPSLLPEQGSYALVLEPPSSPPPPPAADSKASCVGHCGGKSQDQSCYCDAFCAFLGDCCADRFSVCP